jgi:TP901 family phage tail tape measure protein
VAMNLLGYKLIIDGLSAFTSDMDKSIRKVEEFVGIIDKADKTGTSAFEALGKAATISTGIVAASMAAMISATTLGIGVLVGITADYNQKIAEVGAITETSGDTLAAFAQHARDIGRELPLSLSKIAQAGGELVRAGLTVEEAMAGATRAVSQLTFAAAGELGLENAARMVAGGLLAFNLQGKDATMVANALTAAAVKSAVTFSDVDRSFRQVASVAAILGYNVQETAALIGVMGQAFLRGSDAGTSLKQMFISLMKPSAASLGFMKEFGLSLYDTSGRVLPFRDVLIQLDKAFGANAISSGRVTEQYRDYVLATMFGSDAIRAAIVLAMKNTDAYDDMLKATKDISVAEIAHRMTVDVLNNQLAITKNVMGALAIEAGSKLEPALARVVAKFNVLLKALKPNQLKLFGEGLAAVMSGGDMSKLGEESNKLLDPKVSKVFTAWLSGLISVKDAIDTKLIPSFMLLWNTITRALGGTDDFVNSLRGLNSFIVTVINGVAVFISLIANLIDNLRASTLFMQLFNIALTGIRAIGFLLIAVAAFNLVRALAQLLVPLNLVAFGIGLVITYSNEILAVAQAVYAVLYSLATQAIQLVITNLNTLATGLAAVIAGLITYTIVVNRAAIITVAKFAQAILLGTAILIAYGIAVLRSTIQTFALTLANAYSGRSFWNLLSRIVLTAFALDLYIKTTLRNIAATVANIAINTIATVRYLLFAAAVFALNVVLAAYNVVVTIATAVTKFFRSGLLGMAETMARLTWTIVVGVATIAKAFGRILVQAVLGAVRIVVVAIASIGWPILAVIAVIAALVAATIAFGINWKDIFDNVAKVIGKVVDWIVDRLKDLFNWLKGLPLIGDAFKAAGEAIDSFGKRAAPVLDDIGNSIGNFIEEAKKGFPEIQKQLMNLIPGLSDFDKMMKELEVDQEKARLEAERLNAEMEAMKNNTGGTPGFLPEPDKSLTDADELKAYIAAFTSFFRSIPGMTKDAIKYMAELVQETPERFAQIAVNVLAARDRINEMSQALQESLRITLAIEQADSRIAKLDTEIAVIDLRMKGMQLQLDQQLLDMRMRELEINMQIAYTQRQIADIDREINVLQRGNLEYVRQLAVIQEQALPYRQAMADIEREITDLTDRRLTLELREQELLQQQSQADVNAQLKSTQKLLDQAWKDQDVTKILDLEKIRQELEAQKTAIEDNLDVINKQQGDQSRAEELARIQLEKKKLALEELLKPYEDQIYAINKLTEAEQVHNAIRLADLEAQKRGLDDVVYSLDMQRQSIQLVIQGMQLQLAQQQLQLEKEKLAKEILLNDEKLKREALLATQLTHNTSFATMVQDFVNLMVKSGVFTQAEGEEVIKRLGFWNEQIGKLLETTFRMNEVKLAADAIKESIDAIPAVKTVDIYITEYRNIVTVPNPNSNPGDNPTGPYTYPFDPNMIGLASGGIIPGPAGVPQVVMAHGGEVFLGTERSIPSNVLKAAYGRLAQAGMAAPNQVVNNYTVNAAYEYRQSPVTVGQDLRAMIGAAQR